jgi:hypothetical protein
MGVSYVDFLVFPHLARNESIQVYVLVVSSTMKRHTTKKLCMYDLEQEGQINAIQHCMCYVRMVKPCATWASTAQYVQRCLPNKPDRNIEVPKLYFPLDESG